MKAHRGRGDNIGLASRAARAQNSTCARRSARYAMAINLPESQPTIRAERGGSKPTFEFHRLIVSVIIPHYNQVDELRDCLRLLEEQSLPREQFEVIVADNNSRCGFEQVERVCGTTARVVPAPIQGAGPARNVAVAASRGHVLAFIDADCRPSRTWLDRGVAALNFADMVGGRVDVYAKSDPHPTGVEAFEKVFAFNFKRYVEELGFSGAGNMFVTRAVFDRVGPFRAEVTEDMDWGLRASAAGFRWHYAADVVVSHPARRTWPEITQKLRRRTREDFAMALERPNGRLLWFLRSFAILASPLAHWIKIARSKKLVGVEQRLKAVAILFGVRFWRFIECNRLLLGRETVSHANDASNGDGAKD
jgi:GT2 family glycosyltransferase